jgi:hypothetical protein
MRSMTAGLLVAVLWGPAAIAPQTSPDAELERLASLLVGDYFSAGDAGVREDRPIYMRIRRVDPPPGRRLALYAEMRHDGAGGELYRQRLYVFDEAPGRPANVMRAWSFVDADAAARLIDDPALLRRSSLATTDTLGPGCEMVWRADGGGFVGRVDPATCRITGKRGDQRRIEAVTRIDARAIGQLERGYDLEGKLLFGSPGGQLNTWPRVK